MLEVAEHRNKTKLSTLIATTQRVIKMDLGVYPQTNMTGKAVSHSISAIPMDFSAYLAECSKATEKNEDGETYLFEPAFESNPVRTGLEQEGPFDDDGDEVYWFDAREFPDYSGKKSSDDVLRDLSKIELLELIKDRFDFYVHHAGSKPGEMEVFPELDHDGDMIFEIPACKPKVAAPKVITKEIEKIVEVVKTVIKTETMPCSLTHIDEPVGLQKVRENCDVHSAKMIASILSGSKVPPTVVNGWLYMMTKDESWAKICEVK